MRAGGQFGRCFFQSLFDYFNNQLDRVRQRLPHLFGGDSHCFGKSRDLITAFDFHHLLFGHRENRSNLDLHIFRRRFADQQVVLSPKILHDGLVHLIAGHIQRFWDPRMRRQIATQLAGVQSVLDGMLVDQPRRRILRARPQPEVG